MQFKDSFLRRFYVLNIFYRSMYKRLNTKTLCWKGKTPKEKEQQQKREYPRKIFAELLFMGALKRRKSFCLSLLIALAFFSEGNKASTFLALLYFGFWFEAAKKLFDDIFPTIPRRNLFFCWRARFSLVRGEFLFSDTKLFPPLHHKTLWASMRMLWGSAREFTYNFAHAKKSFQLCLKHRSGRDKARFFVCKFIVRCDNIINWRKIIFALFPCLPVECSGKMLIKVSALMCLLFTIVFTCIEGAKDKLCAIFQRAGTYHAMWMWFALL